MRRWCITGWQMKTCSARPSGFILLHVTCSQSDGSQTLHMIDAHLITFLNNSHIFPQSFNLHSTTVLFQITVFYSNHCMFFFEKCTLLYVRWYVGCNIHCSEMRALHSVIILVVAEYLCVTRISLATMSSLEKRGSLWRNWSLIRRRTWACVWRELFRWLLHTISTENTIVWIILTEISFYRLRERPLLEVHEECLSMRTR